MWITGLASSWPVIRPNPRTSRQPAQSHRAVLQQPRARTLPGVLFPTVNVRRKRPRSAVTNVRRAGSRPYFEWESELRRCTRLPASPPPSRPGPRSFHRACCLPVGAIDCEGSPSILPLFVRTPAAAHLTDNTVRIVRFTIGSQSHDTNHPLRPCLVLSRNSILRQSAMNGCSRLGTIILTFSRHAVPRRHH